MAVSLLSVAQAKDIYAVFDTKADQSAELSLSSGGIINTLNVDIGDRVEKGDLLLELDNVDLKASLLVSKANLKSAQIRLKFAQRSYNRQKKVKHLLDQAEFDKFSQDLENAKTNVAQMKATLSYQEALLKKSRLVAPFDGVISNKLTEVGNAISGGNPKTLLELQSSHKIKLLLSYDAKYWNDVKVGNNFRYKVDGNDASFEGKITKIYPAINSNTKMMNAEVQTENIPVGLFGTGFIITE